MVNSTSLKFSPVASTSISTCESPSAKRGVGHNASFPALPLSGQPQLVVIGTGHAQSRVVIDILYVELYLALHHCRTAGNHLACHVVERESVAVTLLIVPIDSQRHM